MTIKFLSIFFLMACVAGTSIDTDSDTLDGIVRIASARHESIAGELLRLISDLLLAITGENRDDKCFIGDSSTIGALKLKARKASSGERSIKYSLGSLLAALDRAYVYDRTNCRGGDRWKTKIANLSRYWGNQVGELKNWVARLPHPDLKIVGTIAKDSAAAPLASFLVEASVAMTSNGSGCPAEALESLQYISKQAKLKTEPRKKFFGGVKSSKESLTHLMGLFRRAYWQTYNCVVDPETASEYIKQLYKMENELKQNAKQLDAEQVLLGF